MALKTRFFPWKVLEKKLGFLYEPWSYTVVVCIECQEVTMHGRRGGRGKAIYGGGMQSAREVTMYGGRGRGAYNGFCFMFSHPVFIICTV